MSKILEVNNLQKAYKDFRLNCSICVEAGRVTGLIGPNGAGKSTTFKAVLGLLHPDAGQIRLFGETLGSCDDAKTRKIKQKIGVALPDSGFSGYLCIREIASVMAAMYPAFDRESFLEKCERMGLPQKQKLKDFSTGMKAKLKVLVALSHDAKLLILDEPTAGLDVAARDEILTMLREFMEEDEERAILICSHMSSDLESLCDDFYMLKEGSIVLHEDADVLMGEYALIKVDEEQYAKLDQQYLLRRRKEPYGYLCLTNQRKYYLENFSHAVVEKSSLDEVMLMMIKGEPI